MSMDPPFFLRQQCKDKLEFTWVLSSSFLRTYRVAYSLGRMSGYCFPKKNYKSIKIEIFNN